jgi:nucleoside-diphosphate-sugar epimerase
MVDRRAVLITGGAGSLGRRIAEQYRATTDLDVVLHTRSEGDLTSDEPFEAISAADRDRVVQIVHSAAVTRFNVDAETADRVNVDGTRRVVEFARTCPGLERLALLSTVYASGLRSGPVAEMVLDGSAGFANHYERSKWEAEQVVAESGLPWQVLRIATIVADDERGGVTQYNAFHTTLRLCFYGLLSVLPGKASTPLYLVTGDFVAEAVADLVSRGEPGVHHLCHRREESTTLGEAIATAFEVFAQDDEFARKGILPPLLADEESFGIMAAGIETFGGEVVSQAMRTVSPFGPQLYIDKDIENANLRAARNDYRAPDARVLVRRVACQLVDTRWGRHVAVV